MGGRAGRHRAPGGRQTRKAVGAGSRADNLSNPLQDELGHALRAGRPRPARPGGWPAAPSSSCGRRWGRGGAGHLRPRRTPARPWRLRRGLAAGGSGRRTPQSSDDSRGPLGDGPVRRPAARGSAGRQRTTWRLGSGGIWAVLVGVARRRGLPALRAPPPALRGAGAGWHGRAERTGAVGRRGGRHRGGQCPSGPRRRPPVIARLQRVPPAPRRPCTWLRATLRAPRRLRS